MKISKMLWLIFAMLVPIGGLVIVAQDNPDIVNIPGTIQAALGCNGEWAPDCEATLLAYNADYNIWEGTFDVPAGGYEYKVAIDGTWGENYGGFADRDGPNISLAIAEDMPVTFVYDHETNWIMDTVRQQIVTAPGNYQDEVGCSGEWQPDCMITWLQDIDGDGIYTYSTSEIPAGDYETKITIGRSWDENYGADGEADGANISFTVPTDGETITFTYDSNLTTMVINIGGVGVTGANLRERRAHWVLADTIAWNIETNTDESYRLLYSADASLEVSVFGLSGNFESFDVTVNDDGLAAAVTDKFPHLADFAAFTLDADALERVGEILTGQFVIAAYRGDNLSNMAGLQIAGVLDDLYTYDGDLGITFADGIPTLTIWSPTARHVSLNLYADSAPRTEPTVIDMVQDAESGTWSITGESDWYAQYYTFNVDVYAPTELAFVDNQVTDPYSVSLSLNSTRSQIIDLTDSALLPDGWQDIEKPEFAAPEDITIYELHIRDFSIFDESVPEELRGTYLAFTLPDSNGMTHLRGLSEAGLTHLHLLPSFDIATINENRARHFSPDYEELAVADPTGLDQQAAVRQITGLDGFNWGYDPYHYMTPEGSYATEGNGASRILEYRQMVQGINNIAGLRVIQDVVFNHTNASGQNARSVLDKVVPGYYHRLDAAGNVTRSTCCENTATEHNMMRRLMIDTIVLNAVQYKIDGFRFDLMGHHMLADMLAVREALDSLTVEADGVDGTSIYLYGEGWNFGEVQDNARGVNATQFNVAGTGIGTFNDRLRDAVRGGSPFGGRNEQGFGNGAYVQPNGLLPLNEDLDRALLFADQIRIGLAGNLRDYTFTDRNGDTASGLDIDYNGSPTGYTLDPQENIIYVDKHDNETLFDNIAYRWSTGVTAYDITRMQIVSNSFVMYSQGVPFFQAGTDMLRSKSLDRDSYDSGDWFNRLDWTYQTNNFRVGLPPADKNEGQYDLILPVLENEALTPTPDDILLSVNAFREILQIRYSSPLFRLQTADDIQARVSFLNTGTEQIAGVIVMLLDDTVGNNLDENYQRIVVIFNARPEALDYAVTDFADMGFERHPVQQNSFDEVAQSATFDNGIFTVPAWTTAVFVLPE
ncbi:MAG: pullulanase-type alpha-1,6-glucosidase [Anaerolineae bacterium]|nr:pullulanase-type alpha-1,6-glucosidase [Anaerolineae bacterium]